MLGQCRKVPGGFGRQVQSEQGTSAASKSHPAQLLSQQVPQYASSERTLSGSEPGLNGLWERWEGHLLEPTSCNNAVLTTHSIHPTQALQFEHSHFLTQDNGTYGVTSQALHLADMFTLLRLDQQMYLSPKRQERVFPGAA